jgi:hypothetical protein
VPPYFPLPPNESMTKMCWSHLITDESHSSIVRPREADDRRVSIVDEFNGPPALILYPHKYDAGRVTRSQLLIGFIPSD